MEILIFYLGNEMVYVQCNFCEKNMTNMIPYFES